VISCKANGREYWLELIFPRFTTWWWIVAWFVLAAASAVLTSVLGITWGVIPAIAAGWCAGFGMALQWANERAGLWEDCGEEDFMKFLAKVDRDQRTSDDQLSDFIRRIEEGDV
jgi:hypothetical protein